jgi:hypothetical protein
MHEHIDIIFRTSELNTQPARAGKRRIVILDALSVAAVSEKACRAKNAALDFSGTIDLSPHSRAFLDLTAPDGVEG